MGYETIEALTISIYRLTDELSSTAAENILLKRQVSELERKRPDVAEQARIRELQLNIQEKDQTIEDLASDRDSLRLQLGEIRKAYPAEQERINQQAKENAELHHQVVELTCQRDEANDMAELTHKQLAGALGEKDQTIKDLSRQLKSEASSCTRAPCMHPCVWRYRYEMRSTIDNLAKQVKNEAKHRHELLRENAEVLKRLEAANEDLDVVVEQLDRVRAYIEHHAPDVWASGEYESGLLRILDGEA